MVSKIIFDSHANCVDGIVDRSVPAFSASGRDFAKNGAKKRGFWVEIPDYPV
jgi:hypothetical protein